MSTNSIYKEGPTKVVIGWELGTTFTVEFRLRHSDGSPLLAVPNPAEPARYGLLAVQCDPELPGVVRGEFVGAGRLRFEFSGDLVGDSLPSEPGVYEWDAALVGQDGRAYQMRGGIMRVREPAYYEHVS
jgi:hypothetical protein